MPSDPDHICVRHMPDAAREAVQYCTGKTQQDLEGDRPLQCLLVRALEVIGEAASRASQAIRDQHPEIPWVRMVGIRNRLIHAYFDIDLDIVWQTVRDELPSLIEHLQTILASDEGL